MEQLKQAMRQMITLSDTEFGDFSKGCRVATYRRLEPLHLPGSVPDCIYFIQQGILRVIITDTDGQEHTIHFAMENQFIADYSSFMLRQRSMYTLQALEETQVVVLPRQVIEWGYTHLQEGQKLGRLIAEYYFVYHDNRIKNLYARTPRERYDTITEVFPGIHNRVPQHMIASYLGITPVHLSRLKKSDIRKV